MNEGWKQVWEDIRHALRGPTAERRGSEGAEEPDRGEAAVVEERETSGDSSPAPSASNTHALLTKWVPVALVAGLVALAGFFLMLGRFPAAQLQPPAPNVVASYNGGQITLEDVQRHLVLLVPDERLRRQFDVAEYRLLVQEMITDELVRRWAAERKVDRDENFQHSMKHLTEEINLDDLHSQMHQGQMGVSASEIQAYYQENRERFGDRTLTQVSDEIQATLQASQEGQFVQDYIDRLKENALITANFELLEVPDPEERAFKAYYEANRAQYVIPEQAVVDEIRIPDAGVEDAAQEKANGALVKLRSGADFAAVADEFPESPFVEQGTMVRKGERGPAYDAVVFDLDEEQISDIFRAGDAFYVVRLRSIQPERQRSLDEVREQVRQALLAEKEAAWFLEKANRPLFTIDGKRYTVGEFWQEYQELPVTFLAGYQGEKGRKALANRLIERLLLVEDSYDQLLSAQNEDEIEEVRLGVLAQMLEQEEVDDKIELSDGEVRTHYEQHKAELVMPPQARIRYIMIRLGQSKEEDKRAWDKANEAHKKLVPGLFKGGDDFAEVAQQYSEDEATASKGGELEGWIGEGAGFLTEAMEHPFHQRVLGLREGEISDPFEWGGALYIVQVLERKEPRPLSFAQVKDSLREELRMKKHAELVAQLSQKLQKQANVIVYDQVLRRLVEQPEP